VFSESPEVVSGLKALFENDCTTPSAPLPSIPDRLIIGPEHSRRRLSEMLSSAKSSIRVMDHRVTDPQILALLAEKQRQGVSVQILGDGPMGGLICHGRMVLIDEKTAIIGSIHLSPPSLDSRREVAIIIEEASIVAELYDYFESLAIHEVNRMNLWATPVLPPEGEDDEEDE
jgi:phosphatidylserine/phosphatidylglycerophosphate/cardiolipin synthase-like enzyme